MHTKLPLILTFLCLLGGDALAQVNLLPQGSFEKPSVNTGWAEGFNIPNNQEFQVVSDQGKHWLRIENRDAGRQLDYVHAYVNVTPQVASLTVSVRMKATNLKIGAEGWHTARIAMSFEGGSFGFPAQVPELRADSDWVTKSVELKVPQGATRLNIQPAMFYCTGVFEIADLSVTPHLVTRTQLGDAVLPDGIDLDWDKASVNAVNAKRAQVSLDGIWQFTPAAEAAVEPPKQGWAYIKVPGDWQIRPGKPSDFLALAGGPQWDLYDGARVTRAWYRRQTRIPAAWQGRAISLRFDRVCTDAMVYVNGTPCGNIAWPWGSVDITSAVKPGETAEIQVLVAAIADAEKVGTFWQNALSDTVTFSSAELKTRGLTGSVFLESRSSEARVTDVFVRTSTRNQNISLDVELSGVAQAGSIQIVAEMLNEQGQVEKSFTADAAVGAQEIQTLALSWLWADPRLWDVGQPNLYTLRLKVQGAGLDDEYNQEFGFREFWVEGREFFLNGSVIRLRQPCFYYGPRMKMGDTFSEMGATNVDTRGDAADSRRNLDDADHQGYLVAQYILNANKYMMNSQRRNVWEQNKQQALDRAAVWMRRYRNHPSIVMWIAGFNYFNNAVDADPRHVGRRDWGESDQRWQRLMVFAKEMFAGLKELDSTRIYYSHSGAYTGDVYTMNCYLDLLPLQEREDWLSAWAESGEMPISMVEFGTPMDCTFRRGRHGFESNITSEPLLTEFAAIYFGPEAYAAEEPKYRQFLRSLFRTEMLYDSSENRLDEYANNHKIQQLYRVNTWRSWRTAGLPGGLRTWSWIQDALQENNGPTLAWIAGPDGAYTAKDHQFIPGQKIKKQIVLINDTRQPQDFTADWTATVGGQQVDGGQVQGSLAVSEIRFISFQIDAPPVEAGAKVDGQITLTASIGAAKHQDAFAFRVFGQDQPGSGQVSVFDPSGLTSNMLAELGYRTHPWTGEAAPLVVIGRDALKNDATVAAKLEPFVRAGGRALICSQDPEWMTRALGWRICPKVARRVFPVDASVTRGIDADDLRDWTGSSTLIDAYPEYVGDYLRGNEREQPYAGWHWGNVGGVSSAAIEKPHRSGWRPLLECEFDLAYSPLMELDYGQGRVIVCTLDLEDHLDKDPVARRMAGQIVDYALRSPLSAQVSKVVYLGGAPGAAWLDKIGVNYQQSDTGGSAADLSSAGLLLIGPDAPVDAEVLSAYLEEGGKIFFLPRAQPDAGLGVILKSAADDFAGSLSVPEWPEGRGLSASDLRWRTHLENAPWIVSAGADIAADGLIGRKVIGKGVAIFCQVDPDRFQADEKTYFRYTRWRSTRAVAQLLANLGASFVTDSRVFHPLDPLAPNLDDRWQMSDPLPDQPGPQATGVTPSGVPMSQRPKPEGVPSVGYYYPDYRADFPMGDNPYRYYRW